MFLRIFLSYFWANFLNITIYTTSMLFSCFWENAAFRRMRDANFNFLITSDSLDILNMKYMKFEIWSIKYFQGIVLDFRRLNPWLFEIVGAFGAKKSSFETGCIHPTIYYNSNFFRRWRKSKNSRKISKLISEFF